MLGEWIKVLNICGGWWIGLFCGRTVKEDYVYGLLIVILLQPKVFNL